MRTVIRIFALAVFASLPLISCRPLPRYIVTTSPIDVLGVGHPWVLRGGRPHGSKGCLVVGARTLRLLQPLDGADSLSRRERQSSGDAVRRHRRLLPTASDGERPARRRARHSGWSDASRAIWPARPDQTAERPRALRTATASLKGRFSRVRNEVLRENRWFAVSATLPFIH
jgi:hypothetical protein